MLSFFSFLFFFTWNHSSIIINKEKKSALHKFKLSEFNDIFCFQADLFPSFRTDWNLSWFVYYHYFFFYISPRSNLISDNCLKLTIRCLRISRSHGPKFLRPSLISMKTNNSVHKVSNSLCSESNYESCSGSASQLLLRQVTSKFNAIAGWAIILTSKYWA
jgi:hypothetical protein